VPDVPESDFEAQRTDANEFFPTFVKAYGA